VLEDGDSDAEHGRRDVERDPRKRVRIRD
jgi:hypothetical protein